MKKLMIWVIFLLILDAIIFYRIGSEDTMNDLRQHYPYLYNIRKNEEGNCCPYQLDDVWLTDSARVNIYTKEGWKRLN